jgi:fluoroacetyl-CoA thioesterase
MAMYLPGGCPFGQLRRRYFWSKNNVKPTLVVGLTYEHCFTLTTQKMVPALYPEAPEFQEMPAVFATGFMVGFLEWACICAIRPHLDGPNEQSVGTMVAFTHEAATPAGFLVTAQVKLTKIEGRKLSFEVTAHDGVDTIARGTHERFVIDRIKFDAKLQTKRETKKSD